MEQGILKTYKHTIEKIFSNIRSRSIIDHFQPEITGDGLPFITEYLRAEKLLLEEIELNGIKESERKFLLKFFKELQRPATSGYMDFALDEVVAGINEVKARISHYLTNRELLTETIKRNGGNGLTTAELNKLAEENGNRSKKNLVNDYRKMKDDLLKKK